MDGMTNQLTELRKLAARAENRRTETGIPRVAMVQGKIPEHQLAAMYDPMINLILLSRDYARVFGLPPARDAARIVAETRGLDVR